MWPQVWSTSRFVPIKITNAIRYRHSWYFFRPIHLQHSTCWSWTGWNIIFEWLQFTGGFRLSAHHHFSIFYVSMHWYLCIVIENWPAINDVGSGRWQNPDWWRGCCESHRPDDAVYRYTGTGQDKPMSSNGMSTLTTKLPKTTTKVAENGNNLFWATLLLYCGRGWVSRV